jgi:hypothetical protein
MGGIEELSTVGLKMIRGGRRHLLLSEDSSGCVYIRVARFVLVQHTKMEKIYQMVTKYTKWSQNIPNGDKIGQ